MYSVAPAVDAGASPRSQASAACPHSRRERARRDRPRADRRHVVVRELARRLVDVAERTRTRVDRLGELDLASQDVLIAPVRALEQQLWMVRAQLAGEDGRYGGEMPGAAGG